MKLLPTLKDYIWGGTKLQTLYGRDNGGKKISESWEVSVHPDGESKFTDGTTLSEYVKNNPTCVDKKGSDLPVLIKYIDAKQNLSVQVHPSDEYAQREEGDNGKTEMWYIVSADEGAGIYCGFNRDVTKEEFEEKIKSGTVEELLNFIPVKQGDCFLIKAGTVHAICAGCLICEVQQNSNVTYRVYDYNRVGADGKMRPLHLKKALDVINFSKFCDETNSGEEIKYDGYGIKKLTTCEYFSCHKLNVYEKFESKNDESFTAYCVLHGKGEINGQSFVSGDSFFIKRGEKVMISGNAEIIVTEKGV